MSDDKKTLKFQMMMSPAEAKLLDDWMFSNRIRSRAEAIRRLWRVGLLFDEKAPAITELRAKLMHGATGLLEALSETSQKDDAAAFKQPAVDVIGTTAFLQLHIGLVTRYLDSIKADLPFDEIDQKAQQESATIEDALTDMKSGKRVKLDVDERGAVIRVNPEEASR